MAVRAPYSPLTHLDPEQTSQSTGQLHPHVPSRPLHSRAGKAGGPRVPATAQHLSTSNGELDILSPSDPTSASTSTAPAIVKRAPRPFRLDPSPSPEESRTVQGIHQLFLAAKQHRNALLPRWNECYRMLTNRHWAPGSRADWMPFPQIPEIFPIIRTLVAWQMDTRFRTTISPASVPHSDLTAYFTGIAKDLEYVLDASWHANIEERQWGMVCWDGLVYGCGFAKTSWEHELAGGLGDAMARHVSPFHLYPDPRATSLDDAYYIIEARRMTLQELDERFPGAARAFSHTGGLTIDIDEPPSILDLMGGRARRDGLNPGALSPSTSTRYARVPNPGIPNLDMPETTVLECWLKEHTYRDVVDPHSNAVVKRAQTSWRVVVVANNRVLLDEPAENIWTHGTHPYSRYQPIDFNAEFWGISMVELLISPQKCLNRILAAIQHNLELAGSPIWLDENGNLANMPVTNKPGQRIPINRGDARTGWLSPPPINAGAQQMVDFILKRMEVISGINAILKGTSPAGRPAQGAVDQIQESSHVGIRSMLRQMEYALRDSSVKKAALIVENYTQPRIVSIAGPQNGDKFRALRARHFLIPSSNGAVPLQYQLHVDAGSRHHVSRQMRENRAVQLFAMELIDELAALEEIDFPNFQLVAQRVQERKQAAAEAEAAAKGGGAAGGLGAAGIEPNARTGARV